MHGVPRYHYISPLRQRRRGALITTHHFVKNSSSLYHYISPATARKRRSDLVGFLRLDKILN